MTVTAVSISPNVIKNGKSILQCSLQYPSFAVSMVPELHVQLSNLGSYIYCKHTISIMLVCIGNHTHLNAIMQL